MISFSRKASRPGIAGGRRPLSCRHRLVIPRRAPMMKSDVARRCTSMTALIFDRDAIEMMLAANADYRPPPAASIEAFRRRQMMYRRAALAMTCSLRLSPFRTSAYTAVYGAADDTRARDAGHDYALCFSFDYHFDAAPLPCRPFSPLFPWSSRVCRATSRGY